MDQWTAAQTAATGLASKLVRFRHITVLTTLMFAIPALSAFTIKGEKIEKRYYPISGTSHGELIKTVRRNGPRAGRAYGLGIIDFFPVYETRRVDGQCRIVDAEVGLRVQLKLPQWQGDAGTPRRVINTARRFERVINAHEMEHVQIARRYARLIQQKLKKLPGEDSCWTLGSKARKLIADLKRQHVWAQNRFDDRTRKQIRRLL